MPIYTTLKRKKKVSEILKESRIKQEEEDTNRWGVFFPQGI